MHRITRWPLMVVLAAALVGASAGQAALAVAATPQPAKVSVTKSSSAPLPYHSETITAKVKDAAGHPVKGAKVVFTWKFPVAKTATAYSNSLGVARSTRNIGSAKAGRKVVVAVKASKSGKTVTGSTYFITKSLIQSKSVSATGGRFNPTALTFTSGATIKITFGRGVGCMDSVQSIRDLHSPYNRYHSLGFRETFLSSGPKTVTITPKPAGTYIIQCGMDMQHCVVTIR